MCDTPPSRLQNVRPVNYGEDSTELFVNLTCPPDYVGRVEASCPGTNATVAMNCSGMYPTIDPLTGVALSFENTWTTQMSCATTVQPTCLLWNAALQAYDDQLCRPVNWTATNTTCACGADASAVASEGGGASFTSGAAALAGYFASMFDPSAFGANLFMQASYGVLHEDRISLQLRRNLLFTQNPLLMATFGTILSLVLLNMARAVVSFSSLFPNFLPIFLPTVIFFLSISLLFLSLPDLSFFSPFLSLFFSRLAERAVGAVTSSSWTGAFKKQHARARYSRVLILLCCWLLRLSVFPLARRVVAACCVLCVAPGDRHLERHEGQLGQ